MRFVIVLLLGFALGLSVGLLLAPSPGRETRHVLRERAEPALERLRQRMRREERAA